MNALVFFFLLLIPFLRSCLPLLIPFFHSLPPTPSPTLHFLPPPLHSFSLPFFLPALPLPRCRDLKSLNVLVCEDPRTDDGYVLKICDFGSSRQLSRDTKSVTSAGTVSWMAPEVIRNEHVTEKCDVWSFGVIAWELVTLEVPYAGMEPYSVLWRVAKFGMRLHIPAECPHKLADLMGVCMAQDPAMRPSFEQIVRRLDELGHDGA